VPGLHTVAEGVENVGQQVATRELGCPPAQGVLFSRPMPMATALALLEERSDARQPPAG
jgi:EAL domain-containing protein (putative c-di-GMP-specific phosphodiesterase class I)